MRDDYPRSGGRLGALSARTSSSGTESQGAFLQGIEKVLLCFGLKDISNQRQHLFCLLLYVLLAGAEDELWFSPKQFQASLR